jgi:hypothetical protein
MPGRSPTTWARTRDGDEEPEYTGPWPPDAGDTEAGMDPGPMPMYAVSLYMAADPGDYSGD